MKTQVKLANSETIKEAAQLLKDGDVVAFPTETVYGLGADATNGGAVKKIFEAKGRPNFNPLISHFYDLSHLLGYADLNEDALQLAESLWPGPLTLIAHRKKIIKEGAHHIDPLVTAGLETIAVRIPDHDVARQLIKETGVPIAAPSANRSGFLSPTSAVHVSKSLDGRIPLILAGKSSTIGLESTIVDCTGRETLILRPGFYGVERIKDVLDKKVRFLNVDEKEKGNVSPKSPGLLLKHYSPNKKLVINSLKPEHTSFYISFGPTLGGIECVGELNLSETGDLAEAASNLFSYLHQADLSSATSIHIAPIPKQDIGIAINERIERASQSFKK